MSILPRFALAVAVTLCVSCQERPGSQPQPHLQFQAHLESALLPAAVAEFRRLPPTPLIVIEARLDPQIDRIAGHQRIWLPNPGIQPLTTVALRCPANSAVFHGASLVISSARWDGVELAAPVVSPDGTGITWTLPRPLAVGAVGCLETAFSATVSRKNGFHGLMARSGARWCLYHWHPELPAWRDGAWELPVVTGIGDESQAPLAHVVTRLNVPTGCQVIAGGSEDQREGGESGRETVTISTPECRSLAIAIAGSGELRCSETQVDGTRVRSWATAAHPNASARALRVAAASLALFNRHFGPYPFSELDVVETTHGDGVGGMESSGLVFIDSQAYAMSEDLPVDAPLGLSSLMLEVAVAHEVGHQWWYGIIGSDAFADPWLDESLTNWTGGWVLERLYGPVGRAASLNLCYMGALVRPQDLAKHLDLPLSGFESMDTDYGPVVYARGGLMYEALRLELGDPRFFAWLRAWATDHRFGIATPADWQQALDKALGVEAGQAFTRLWVHGKGLTRSQMRAPLMAKPRP